MNSLAFVFPAGTTQTSQDFQNSVLLWKQAPETPCARLPPVTGFGGARGTSWSVLFPPGSLEVGPAPHPSTATISGPFWSQTSPPDICWSSFLGHSHAAPSQWLFTEVEACGSVLPVAIQNDLGSKWQVNKLRKQILVNFVVHASQNMSRAEGPI